MTPSKINAKHGYSNPKGGIDWLDTTINGGSLLLTIVSDAAKAAPVPYLQQAAGITIKIVQAIQAVKDNKMAFRRIAHQAMELVAAIWQAYERSTNKPEWPPREINVVIEDLLGTLNSIYELVDKQLSRAKYKRFFSSTADLQTIAEYRERLQASVNKFEISSHLSIHDTLSFVIKSQIQAQERQERERMAQAERDRLDLHRRRLEEETRFREQEEARRAQQAADDMLKLMSAEHEEREREREETQAQDAIMRIHYVTDAQVGERERRQAAATEERERQIKERELERERMAREDEERLARLRAEERAKADLEHSLREQAEMERRRMEAEMNDVLERERKKREELETEAVLENSRLRHELERARVESEKEKGKGKRKEDKVEERPSIGRVNVLHQGVGASGNGSVMMEAALGRYSVQVKQEKRRPVSKKPRVQTEDEDEDEDSERTISDEDERPSSESSWEDETSPPSPPKKKKKKSRNRPARSDSQTPELALRQQLLALGIDLNSIQNRTSNANVTAAAGVGVDSLGAAYANLRVNSNAAQAAPPPPPPPPNFYVPQYGGIPIAPSPSPHPHPGQTSPYPAHTPSPPPPGMYPQYYAPLGPTSPTGYVAPAGGYLTPVGYSYAQPGGYNTGNVTNTTISNVGNNYSVSTVYEAPEKKKKRRTERV